MKQTKADVLPKRVLVWVYGGLTAVLLLALFFAMRTIAQYPLVTTHVPTFLQEGWQPYNDPQGFFTMDVRSDWQELTPEDEEFAQVVGQVTAVLPFEPQLIFHPPENTQTIVGVSSLNDPSLSIASIRTKLIEAGFEIRQEQSIQTEMGHTRNRIIYLNEQYSCVLYIMPIDNRAIGGCEARTQTVQYSVLFENWLASFQQLSRP